MNDSTWKDKAELIGVIAILATLILLIVEINSNTAATRSQIRQSTADGVRQFTLAFSSDEKIRDLVLSDEGIESLSRSDANAIGAFSHAYFMTVEEAYLQWTNGFLDEELWLNRKNHALWWLQQRRVRELWDTWQGRGYFTDSFMAVMNAELEAR